eukprot:s1039_g7.t1
MAFLEPAARGLWDPAPSIISCYEELALLEDTGRQGWILRVDGAKCPVLAVCNCLAELIQRHGSCRTSFWAERKIVARMARKAPSIQECHSLEKAIQRCCCGPRQPFHAFHVGTHGTRDAAMAARATVAVAAHPAVLDESSCQQLLLELLQMLAVLLGIQDFQWPAAPPVDRADVAVACPASRWMGRPLEIEQVQVPCEVAHGNLDPSGLALRLEVLVTLVAVWLRRNFPSKLVIGIPQRVLPSSGALGCFTALLSLSVELQPKQQLGEAVQMVHEELQRVRKEALRGEVGCLEEERLPLALVNVRSPLPELQEVIGALQQHGLEVTVDPLPPSEALPRHLALRLDLDLYSSQTQVTLEAPRAQQLLEDFIFLIGRAKVQQPLQELLGALDPLDPVTDDAPDVLRAAVLEALPEPEVLRDDVPLRQLGLDSISAVFLKGRLSELFGASLPGALDAQMSTLTDLAAALCREDRTSEGSLGPVSGALARLAEESDWPKLREMWAEHHHLLEMVHETSCFVLLGPPAWAAVLTTLLGFYLQWKGLETVLLKVSLVYALLAVLQHFLHWMLAKLILAYDLRYGELTAHGWKAKGSKGQPSAVIVVESPRGELLGVLCVRTSLRSGCRRRRRWVTSLWHATVRPEARNVGVCGQLLRRAEQWAEEVGAQELEAVCLNPAAKAACWNMALELQNPKTGRWPLIPAFFSKTLRREMAASVFAEAKVSWRRRG